MIYKQCFIVIDKCVGQFHFAAILLQQLVHAFTVDMAHITPNILYIIHRK